MTDYTFYLSKAKIFNIKKPVLSTGFFIQIAIAVLVVKFTTWTIKTTFTAWTI